MFPQPDLVQPVYEWLRRIVYFLWVLFGQQPGVPPPVIPPLPPPVKPAPPPQPPAKGDPVNAIVRITSGSAGCTATITGPQRAEDGRVLILTAAHCVRGNGAQLTARLKDGRSFRGVVVSWNRSYDLAWAKLETSESLPFARLAQDNPQPGTAVWHMGYGVNVPGNREAGRVLSVSPQGTTVYTSLSVSSGDSGSGVFREDTGELVAVVSGYSGRTNVSGSVRRSLEIRPPVQSWGDLIDYGP